MHGRLFQFELPFGQGFIMPFPSYFTLVLAGFLLATVMGAIWARRVGQDPDVIVDLGLAMVLAGIAGGRLLHVFVDGQLMDYVHLCTDPSKVDWNISRQACSSSDYNGIWDASRQLCHPRDTDCWAWARFYAGGLVYYGGFAGASAAAWYLLRTDRFPFWKAADMAGMVVPVGLGFGRIGCLLAGCCFGKPWHSSWAVTFPGNSPASEAQHKLLLLGSAGRESLPVHPTQLYESLASFAIAAFLILWLHGKKRYDGQVFLAFVALYGGARFLLEFLRADDRGALLGLSTSQLLSLALFGAAYYFHQQRAKKVRAALGAAPAAPVAA